MAKRPTFTITTLFGGEEKHFLSNRTKRPNLFGDHDEFTEKFKSKKTTDDCYTPPDIYDIVLSHVRETCDIGADPPIIRPFFPDCDYELVNYPPGCVVVDNPPFSIITKIAKYYIKKKIKFFLFAPHLTLFGASIKCTHVVVGGDIIYENGAAVKTSFLTNVMGDLRVVGDAVLCRKFYDYYNAKKRGMPKYVYPANVLTVSHVAWLVERGISLKVSGGQAAHCRALDSQKTRGKGLFGSGYLVSDDVAKQRAELERQAGKQQGPADIVWEISPREREIIENLNNK